MVGITRSKVIFFRHQKPGSMWDLVIVHGIPSGNLLHFANLKMASYIVSSLIYQHLNDDHRLLFFVGSRRLSWGNVDFVSGFLLGLFCACMAFVAQTSMSEPVQLTFYPGRLAPRSLDWQIAVAMRKSLENEGNEQPLRFSKINMLCLCGLYCTHSITFLLYWSGWILKRSLCNVMFGLIVTCRG